MLIGSKFIKSKNIRRIKYILLSIKNNNYNYKKKLINNFFLIFLFFRKLKPPVPKINHKYIKLANTPEIFEDNNKNINKNSNENTNAEKYFDNWSFINN